MIQFTANNTFALRAVSLYDSPKAYRTAEGDIIFKAGEKSQKGIAYGDGTEVTAIEKFSGGGWLCRFPGGELGYVDPNKIQANAEELAAKKAVTTTATKVTTATAVAMAPTTPAAKLKALIAEKAALEARMPALAAEIEAARIALQQARAEEDALLSVGSDLAGL